VGVAALSVPFRGKAFHVDDPSLLAVAGHVLSDPVAFPRAPLESVDVFRVARPGS
jgi:hypothetical protein